MDSSREGGISKVPLGVGSGKGCQRRRAAVTGAEEFVEKLGAVAEAPGSLISRSSLPLLFRASRNVAGDRSDFNPGEKENSNDPVIR